MNVISLEKYECDGIYVLNMQDLVRLWRLLMFKLKHSDSILNFMLKTIQIHLMRIRQKNVKKKNPYSIFQL